MGNTIIGGALVSTHVGSSNDNSEVWHKRLGHLSEGDDFSRKVWVYFMKHKSEVFNVFKQWKARLENQTGKKRKYFISANGMKYKDKEFLQFYKDKGIIRHFSVKRTPEQNGVAKRVNRTLLERARCMRLNADLSKSFWAEVVNTTCYLINRSPSSAINHRVPEEEWSDKQVSFSAMRIFGCPAYVHLHSEERSKLDPKSKECIFLGEFDIKDLGSVKKILGVEIHRDRKAGKLRSMTGYIFTFYGGPLCWKSVLQFTTTLSTTEAEYMALTECDSQNAMDLAKNQVFHARTKHIDGSFQIDRTLRELRSRLSDILGDEGVANTSDGDGSSDGGGDLSERDQSESEEFAQGVEESDSSEDELLFFELRGYIDIPRRKVTDEPNDEVVHLTEQEVKMIRKPYVDWFKMDAKHPLSSAPEPKSRFVLSKWENEKLFVILSSMLAYFVQVVSVNHASCCKGLDVFLLNAGLEDEERKRINELLHVETPTARDDCWDRDDSREGIRLKHFKAQEKRDLQYLGQGLEKWRNDLWLRNWLFVGLLFLGLGIVQGLVAPLPFCSLVVTQGERVSVVKEAQRAHFAKSSGCCIRLSKKLGGDPQVVGIQGFSGVGHMYAQLHQCTQLISRRSYPLFASCSEDSTAYIFHGMVYSDLNQKPLVVALEILRGHASANGRGVLDCKFHPRQPWSFTAGADSVIKLLSLRRTSL
ncbi:hypothetical protein RJ639_034496 [Escallonia herrerae]|uniref:Integrase catalytic domain-containing protein n=1 Tax=Escallonia herrerae TaxID=1293975 RepID=A0AA89BJ85_9ASTE|nr:hypothetical protein RJ639_034496 [Escallonia herrerae]